MQAYPPRGGNHLHAYELVQGFHAAGHKTFVLGDPTMPNAENVEEGRLADFLSLIDILYIRIDGRSTRQSKVVNKSVLRSKVPVVWEINAPANEALAFSWLGGKTSTRKESALKVFRRSIHALRQQPRIILEELHRRRLARKVDAAICVSEALATYARQKLKIAKSVALPNGGPLISKHEIDERRSKRKSTAFTILYSGSVIYPWQGMQYIFDVIRLAETEAPDIKFVLAVNTRTPLLPDSKNVEILEGLDRNGILNAVCQADVCIALHPEYTWSKWGFHNSPMKLYEYMACMTASLSSNHGQMKEVITHEVDGLLCSNDAEDILQSILKLQADEPLRKSIAENGWLRVQTELNWKQNAGTSLALFEELAGKEQSPTQDQLKTSHAS